MNNYEARLLAHEAGEKISVAEAKAIENLIEVIEDKALVIYLCETICEHYGWFQDADAEHLEYTGDILQQCALISLGSLKP